MVWTSKNCPKSPVSSEESPLSYPEGATAALEQIAIVCTDNMGANCNHRMALDFVRQIANDCLSRAPAQAPTYPVSADLFDVALRTLREEAPSLSETTREYIARTIICRARCIPDPAQAQRYRHKKRGSVYRVLHEATMSTSEVPRMDDEPMVVYQCETDGKVWVRPVAEFYDGRFVWLALSSTEPRCTCAVIVNPNIPHARSCPLSDHKS